MYQEAIAQIINTAVWWISDDLFVWVDGSFYSSKNIEIRDNARWIKLTKAMVKDSSTTVTERINYFLKINTAEYLAFGNSWGIYRKVSWTWNKVTTDSPASAILWACEFNGYIYWTTVWYLHRILKSNVSNNISATDVINWQALESSTRYPMITMPWVMYVWNGKFLSNVDIGNVFNEWTNVGSDSAVLFLDSLWSNVRAISSSALWWYKINLMNLTTKEISQTIPLIWYNIKSSIIFNGMHYLVTNKWLWVLDWYNVHIIKNTNLLSWENWWITVFDNNLYITWTWWIYCFGSKTKDYPQSLNLQHTTSNGNVADDIWWIFSDGTDLYVWWKQSTSHWIDKIGTTYATSWELTTRWYFANSLHDIKDSISISFWYKPLLANEKIKLQYSVNWWAFTDIIEITSASVNKDLFTEDMLLPSKFQYIQFKIILEWSTTTPEFYSIILRFNNWTRR